MELKLLNIEAAYRKVIDLLMSRGAYIKNIIPINLHRYIIAQTTIGNFLIMYKRDVFHNFYNLHEGISKTVGESVNNEDIKLAIQKEVIKIFTTYPNGHIYSIDMQNFLINSIKWTTMEGKEIRSCSIHLFKREEENDRIQKM